MTIADGRRNSRTTVRLRAPARGMPADVPRPALVRRLTQRVGSSACWLYTREPCTSAGRPPRQPSRSRQWSSGCCSTPGATSSATYPFRPMPSISPCSTRRSGASSTEAVDSSPSWGSQFLAPLHADSRGHRAAPRSFPSPLTLEPLQVTATAIAALLLLRIQKQQGLDPWLATGLALVFLLSRRTHGAVVGSFYPEALQAPLTFAMVLLWPSRRWWVFQCIVLLLMTKEDAAIYVGAFRGLRDVARPRFPQKGVVGVAGAWFAFRPGRRDSPQSTG